MPTGETISKASEVPVRLKQRVLVLQGGGALGAYEAGAFRTFYDWLVMQTNDDSNIFDVIAGTSIGAINASIIISHLKKKREDARKANREIRAKACWEGVAEELDGFWLEKVCTRPISSAWISSFWNPVDWHGLFPGMADAEAARKYYATKEAIFQGSRGVFASAIPPLYDFKYFDPLNAWYRSSNTQLKATLQDYVKNFPLKTEVDKNEPRLLTVTVDVITGKGITFDSYEKIEKDGDGNIVRDEKGLAKYSCHTMYRDVTYDSCRPVIIKYSDGLAVEHVLASASVPINFNYQWIPLEYDYRNPAHNRPSNPDDEDRFRPFWDGGIMSNTPLTELLMAHRAFWMDRIGNDELERNMWKKSQEVRNGPLNSKQVMVPNVDVYMINLWPAEIDSKYLPCDHDLIQARQNDITFGDRTQKDQEVAEGMTDYVALIRRIKETALENAGNEKDRLELAFNRILDETANENRVGKNRSKYRDLLLGVFDVEKVLRVERKADKDAIFNMMLDFSEDTIRKMRAQGRHDALQTIINHSIELVKYVEKEMRDAHKEKTGISGQLIELRGILEEAVKALGESTDDGNYDKAMSLLRKYLQKRNELEEIGRGKLEEEEQLLGQRPPLPRKALSEKINVSDENVPISPAQKDKLSVLRY